MAKNRKTENGINYRIERRRDYSITEWSVFWRGEDGSVLELTNDERLERDTSRSIND
jgi:hypothetical protein